ncbi:YheT family hydrolase [Variovorax terrae]|uniref:Alpha/beta hydrolase n=1 Tax=Variovorax terrae TaxID=2923278 RepID=A0A9X1VX58_9BURK|nr:alpha/beta fold hydrolase [Variovorax terrae]MCJ0764625.1 alpha/beta hydrolase [Variovorax terrae]
MNYVAPFWLPGGNLQTIWPALFSRRAFGPPPQYQRERWGTPDGDFIDVDWLAPPGASREPRGAAQPLLVLFHGLEGTSRSHYAEAFADLARERGWAYAVPHFRGCSGEINLAPRAYHSGDFEEIGWILQRFRAQWKHQGGGPLVAVGISLGGNALLRWAEEMGEAAAPVAEAVASVCSPVDLTAGGQAIGRGFNRLVYTRMFLNTMVPKALQKLDQHPGLFDREALLAARSLYEFDNVFTAPLHGFRSTDDYWARASAKPQLDRIRIPALVVNARNDPFVPSWCLPRPAEVGERVTLWQPVHGGHVGFPQGPLPGHVRSMPDAVGGWLAEHS